MNYDRFALTVLRVVATGAALVLDLALALGRPSRSLIAVTAGVLIGAAWWPVVKWWADR